MKARPLTLAMTVLLTACDTGPEATDARESTGSSDEIARPDPAACPPPEHTYDEQEFGRRDEPLSLPAELAAYVATDGTNLAVATRGGGQLCQDVSWTYALSNAELLSDDRLLGWEWDAFEAFGYTIVDRQGQGSMIETGARPSFSPSGARLASLQVSDSGWGGLEGFAVWELRSDHTVEIGRHAMGDDYVAPKIFWEPVGEWTIVGWDNENCVNIRMEPYEQSPEPDPPGPRAYRASTSANWQVTPGACS